MSSILFIAPSAYMYGGLATWLDYLVPGLENSGWEVTVGLVSGKYHDAGAYLKQHPFRRSLALENKSGSLEGRIRATCRAIEKVNPQLVVGVNIPDTYAAVERLRLKKKSDCKVAMTLHGFSPKLYDDMLKYSQLLDGVICTNKLGCALAEQTGGIEKSRIHYAPYGVWIPEARPKSLDGKTLKIIYVGRLGENFQKRVTDIPGIVDFLDRANLNYELKIVGSGEEEALLRETMRGQISEKRISFTGALFGDELSKIYDWANVILLTSFWETGPIVAWEAMAHKVAVVSSSYIGLKSEGSLIDGHNCLLFPIGDTKAAAECLTRAADPAIRAKLSASGHKMVLEKYMREISASLWDKAFKDILSAHVIPSLHSVIPAKAGIQNPSGRLDRIFGVSIAENIRELLGVHFKHTDAGGEWPHTCSYKAQDDKGFWRHAKTLDAVSG